MTKMVRTMCRAGITMIGTCMLAACGGDANAPEDKTAAKEAPAAKSPEEKLAVEQITLLNKVADDMNAIKSLEDANRVKRSLATSIVALTKADKKSRDLKKKNKAAGIETQEPSKRMQMSFMKAYSRYGRAQSRLSKDHPEALQIILIETRNVPQ